MPRARIGLSFLSAISCLAAGTALAQPASLDRGAAGRIAALINDYRAANGLPRIPISAAMTLVAETHALDMAASPDGGASPQRGRDARGLPCNSHSWSDRGSWTPVCYTEDHRYGQAMWDKPREISRTYRGNGFEIGYWTGGGVDPAGALASWRGSPAHDGVILQQGDWGRAPWRAMGVGVAGHHAFVWFGWDPDPEG